MLRITGFRSELDETEEQLLSRVKRFLQTEDITQIKTVRRAVDARHTGDVHYVLSIDVGVKDEAAVLKKNIRTVTRAQENLYEFPNCPPLKYRPLVVGSGPAGLFCTLFLARAGHRPILIERGADVDTRTAEVESFWKDAAFNPDTNVQFGEGGAGTFSDGKLATGTKDRRIRAVLSEFVRYGAPEDILIDSKPHIGTDKLRSIVRNMREDIIRLGAEVRFNTKLSDIAVDKGQAVGAVLETAEGIQELPARDIVLAIGHSARDTVEMLLKRGVVMTGKPFSVGVRIEHSQEFISKAMYGAFADRLPPADYKLAVHLPNGRSLYTFCMCPGGYVVAAASERGGIVTNGMSYSSRKGRNANSALLVGVYPEDFGEDDPLAGIRFQREIEQKAFGLTGCWRAPAQTVGDFLGHKKTIAFKEVVPTYLPGVVPEEIDSVLPEFVCEALRSGLLMMDKKIHGFAADSAVLTAPETRSSSPVRFVRDENMQLSVKGLYSAGEGGGHAGGITSSAVDGIKAAEAVVQRIRD